MNVDLYLRVREKEGRLYSDDIVARLPLISKDHPLADEWRARSASASRLTRYLSTRPKPLTILELGCGNGWLSNRLSKPARFVIGMDRNRRELEQAARVFSQNSKLFFLEADIFCAPFEFDLFDVILLSSVIQYFRDLPALLRVLSRYLKPHGEIHVLDSPLYSDAELDAAIQRSRQYYLSLGFPGMAEHYFHHRLSDLNGFEPKMLYRPQPLVMRLKRTAGLVDSPFPWIVIWKENVR